MCDDCQHNTEGKNCEICIPGYYKVTLEYWSIRTKDKTRRPYIGLVLPIYQDPERQITDHDICALCDCEADGTVDEGMCDESTSEELGTQAGQCHCKTYVGGPRCDHCAPGNTGL